MTRRLAPGDTTLFPVNDLVLPTGTIEVAVTSCALYARETVDVSLASCEKLRGRVTAAWKHAQ